MSLTAPEGTASVAIDGMTASDYFVDLNRPEELLYRALVATKNRRGMVNLAVATSLARVRAFDHSLSEQSLPTAALEQAIGLLVQTDRIALVGWNGNGAVPRLSGRSEYQLRIF